jgi:hypothetical protein
MVCSIPLGRSPETTPNATLASLFFLGTRFLDHVGRRRPNADAASGVYFLGSKAIHSISRRKMIAFYEQQAPG